MIHITQGHEKGIGTEVFIKSLLYLSQSNIDKMKFYCNLESLENSLKSLSLEYKINDHFLHLIGKKLSLHSVKVKQNPTLDTLKAALNNIDSSDILFTLPTSKDQLSENDQHYLGYTEYLRNFFNNPYVTMCFYSDKQFISLLTDHININQITSTLNPKNIELKAKTTLDNVSKLRLTPDNVFFSGINPHSGEGGLIGTEDNSIKDAIKNLKKTYPSIYFEDLPQPADTIHFKSENSHKEIIFFSSHDQGLTQFKKQYGLLAVNVSLGLPFIRMSVDHGTAFPLYGQNKASSTGCLYCLKQALSWINND